MSEKIGLGIITYNRPDYFERIIKNVPLDVLDEIVVVNDGTPYEGNIPAHLIQHTTNKGVGVSKNDALRYLQAKNCDHFFLMEDDILINDKNVFHKYIETSKHTGIQHLNFSQHGLMNKFPRTEIPAPRVVIDFPNNIQIALYPHCVGAFSYYSKTCIDSVGLLDEDFYNAWEHVEHTYRIINNGLHPDFWWFADIANSNSYLSDIPWTAATSTISSKSNHSAVVAKANVVFMKKHATLPTLIPVSPVNKVKQSLKDIYNKWKI